MSPAPAVPRAAGRARRARSAAFLARFAACCAALLAAACDRPVVPTGPELDPALDADVRRAAAGWGAIPIGTVAAQDPALVELGRMLVFDKVLSGNRDISCATCHHPRTHGGDGLALSIGTGGTGQGPDRVLGDGREFVPRNAPSFLNQGLRSFYILWDGRVEGFGGFRALSSAPLPHGLPNILAAQAMLPVLDRREMRGEPGDADVFGAPNELAAIPDDEPAAVWDAIMARLLAIPAYRQMFHAAFPTTSPHALRFGHAATAIAAFVTDAFTVTASPFDRYLAGDDAALSIEAKRGALLFFTGRSTPPVAAARPTASFQPPPAPCASCHGGALLGGQSFANIGVPQLGPGTGAEAPLDVGRAGVVDPNAQRFYRFAFRVPPLRNVELTAPYMHNGAYATLEAAVRHYDDAAHALRAYDRSQLDPRLRDAVHDDDATIADVLSTLDHRLRTPLGLTDDDVRDLVAFLRSLTDPAARDLSGLAPVAVPSGLPVQ